MKYFMKYLLIILLGIYNTGFAQSVSLPVNSIWSFTEDQKNSLAATLLRKNATTGNLEAIPGQRIALEQMRITYGKVLVVPVSMSATFPGAKTTSLTVWGLRVFHSGSGTGWTMPEHHINIAFNEPLNVPAGQKIGCLYEMPIGEMGKLSCLVGALPAVTSTVISITAPNGSLGTPNGTWSFGTTLGPGGNALLLNGTHVGNGYGIRLTVVAGEVYTLNLLNDWYKWSGTSWIRSPAP